MIDVVKYFQPTYKSVLITHGQNMKRKEFAGSKVDRLRQVKLLEMRL